MDKFTKGIELSFGIDEKSRQRIDEFIKSFDDVNIDLIDDDAEIEKLKNIAKEFKQIRLLTVEGEKDKVEDKSTDKDEKEKSEKEKDDLTKITESFLSGLKMEFSDAAKFATNWQAALGELAAKIIADFVEKVGDLFKQAWKELDTILDYSQLTDQTIREQAFSYGLTPSQNYALSKTMDFMGLKSEEDMWYMTTEQWEQFNSRFNEYVDKYDKLYDEGFFDELQEFQWEFAEFKDDLMYDALEFIVENKDIIQKAFEAILVITEIQLDIFDGLLEFWGMYADYFDATTDLQQTTYGYVGEKASSVASAVSTQVANVVNSTTNNATNNNQQVKIDNTFNNVSKADQSWISNAVGLNYEQLIEVLRVN